MSSEKPPSDFVHDFLGQRNPALDVFFSPKHIAVIGATETEGSVGRTLIRNLLSTPFGGTVYPVNPKRASILGIKAYPSVTAISDPIDLAVVVTPAPSVPGIIRECVAKGVRAAIVISAGFKETGAAGVELERQLLAEAQKGGMRIIGPNCLGVQSPITGLNATFASTIAKPGNVAFISQSGALLTAILDWSLKENVGFSSFVSVGSMLDIGWGDLIDYFGDDPKTKSIVVYMETIGDARAFMSAAREVSLTKPVIVIKAGRTEAAAKAAASHTGSLAGSDDVLNAAFERCGVLRVNEIADVFSMAEILGKQPNPKGPRLCMVTNAGGPGVLATDALLLNGGELSTISAQTIETLNGFLPAAWSHNNPIDVLGDASAERYAKALEVAAADPANDGLLVILTPQAMTDPTATAEALKPYSHLKDKPVLASWMGGADVAAGESILQKAGIPVFAYPDQAARAFSSMWRYSANINQLYQTPTPLTSHENISPERTRQLLASAHHQGRSLLTEKESKDLLEAYGIPTVKTIIATHADEAIQAADAVGYPVVLKLHSEIITHKTDAGGVKLHLKNSEEVASAFREIQTSVEAYIRLSNPPLSSKAFLGVTVQPMILRTGYELILGSYVDPQFGPVILFGSGGVLVEVVKDRALALPPLNSVLSKNLIQKTKIAKALGGIRGRKPVDLDALADILVRFSQLIADQPLITEMDLNPLLASPEGSIALDARVVLDLHMPATTTSSRLVIRPYPIQHVNQTKLNDGKVVTIRPIRPEDENALAAFHQTLSEKSVYARYFQNVELSQRVRHERLVRRCHIDYDREMALVAEGPGGTNGRELLGIARWVKWHGAQEADLSMLVSDPYQHQGLGTELLKRLIDVARAEGLRGLHAEILQDNPGMKRLCEKLGFVIQQDGLQRLRATLPL